MATDIKLMGRIFIRGEIETLTGLRIGGSDTGVSIGGAENVVIRNGLDGKPYIPGSSIKGKIRGTLERIYTPGELKPIGNVRVYKVQSVSAYNNCFISHLFGVTPEDIKRLDGNAGAEALPTRLIFRDAMMSPESAAALERSPYTDMPYTQVKTEVAIDRITSAANPRQMERVPAGVCFTYEVIMSVFRQDDLDWLDKLTEGLDLLEEDYLGGSGSRGYGKIRFATREVTTKAFNGSGLDQDSRVVQFQTAMRRTEPAA